MKLKQLFCSLALATPVVAQADFLSISAGGGVWNESPSGNFQKQTDTTAVDVEKDLLWDSESQGYYFVTFEHFVPLVPNIKISGTKIDHSGSGNVSFVFDGDTYNGNVNNEFSLKTLDLIAYYELLDNVVSLDIGLNIRNLKVDYNLTARNSGGSITQTTSDSISETIPMLYALVGASPYPDLILSGEISYIAFDGNSMSDITAKIAYTTNFFVGLEAGYRIQKYELDDVSSTDADLSFDGAFIGAYLKF